MSKELLYPVVVAIIVIAGNLLIEWAKTSMAKRAAERKASEENANKRELSEIELRKIEETNEIELLKVAIARGQSLESYVDELRKQHDEILKGEIERLKQENFELRQNLTSSLLAVELIKRGARAEDVTNAADRILQRLDEWRKDAGNHKEGG